MLLLVHHLRETYGIEPLVDTLDRMGRRTQAENRRLTHNKLVKIDCKYQDVLTLRVHSHDHTTAEYIDVERGVAVVCKRFFAEEPCCMEPIILFPVQR